MDTSTQADKSGWWVAYFIIIVVLAFLGVVFGTHSPLSLLSSIFNAFGLVGLWGYLSDKAVGWRLLWVTYVCVMFFGVLVGFLPAAWHGATADAELLVLVLVVAAFSAPLWWANWRYAFRSPHIWQQPPQQAAA